jgi:peptidoglycan/LPS O-acetylase OafA/YrhL
VDIGGDPAPRERLDFLDAARGGAAMLVLAEHGLHACVPGYLEFSRANVIIGQAAIVVFFMVSGFVIPMSLEGGGSNATFWLRRFFRLFPVYWLSIALAYAYLRAGGTLGGVGVKLSDTASWLSNLVLAQGCLNRPNVWEVFWTLPYELMIYAACSVLFLFGLMRRVGGAPSSPCWPSSPWSASGGPCCWAGRSISAA